MKNLFHVSLSGSQNTISNRVCLWTISACWEKVWGIVHHLKWITTKSQVRSPIGNETVAQTLVLIFYSFRYILHMVRIGEKVFRFVLLHRTHFMLSCTTEIRVRSPGWCVNVLLRRHEKGKWECMHILHIMTQ